MSFEIDRHRYAELFGPTEGDSIRLGDTELYRDYGVMRNMPADTVICLFKPLWKGGKSSKEEFYAREKKTFIAIVEYGADTQSDT